MSGYIGPKLSVAVADTYSRDQIDNLIQNLADELELDVSEVVELLGEKENPLELIATATITDPVSGVDFTDLEEYSEIVVLCPSIVSSSAGYRTVLVSIDNGSNFITSNYFMAAVAAASTEGFFTHDDSGGTTRHGWVKIFDFNKEGVKLVSNAAAHPNRMASHHSETTPFNAIRVAHTGGNFTAGTIHVYGRKG